VAGFLDLDGVADLLDGVVDLLGLDVVSASLGEAIPSFLDLLVNMAILKIENKNYLFNFMLYNLIQKLS